MGNNPIDSYYDMYVNIVVINNQVQTLEYLMKVHDKYNQDYSHLYIEKDHNQIILKNNYHHLIIISFY
jgi:hypothetical protein